MKRMKKLLCVVLALGFIGATFTGCNTFRGAGRDVERAGEEIQDVGR